MNRLRPEFREGFKEEPPLAKSPDSQADSKPPGLHRGRLPDLVPGGSSTRRGRPPYRKLFCRRPPDRLLLRRRPPDHLLLRCRPPDHLLLRRRPPGLCLVWTLDLPLRLVCLNHGL
ncbi:hypothetical protein GOODEAATRI_031348 [Goodea atripinnis]|uniref:Uncharacterized protein n=1 Tax=Goodea atripinnis TaxID=208336 RepID=A0ABV0N602_9TELE